MTGPQLVEGDGELMARILADSGVEREVSAPSGTAWIGHLAREISERIAAVIARGFDAAAGAGALWTAAAGLIIAAAVTLLLWALVRWLTARRRGGSAGGGAPVAAPAAARERGTAPEGWRRELERCLQAGRLGEALAAAWWWLAVSLAGGEADPTWTNRELLLRSRRRGAERRRLAPLLAEYDRLAYGPAAPTAGELRRLVAGIEGVLG